MNIDWSKAPEGFPLWIEDLRPECGGDMGGWHREESDRFVALDGTYWSKGDDMSGFKVHRQPQWDGEGLPPVGVVCEFRVDANEWLECVVIAHHAGMAVCWIHCNKIFSTNGSSVRPAPTMEQIAAEAREKAIATMVADLDVPTSIAARAYDAGYYKFEIVDEQP